MSGDGDGAGTNGEAYRMEISKIAAVLNEAGTLERKSIHRDLDAYVQRLRTLGDTGNVKKVRVALDYMLVNEANDNRKPGLWPLWEGPDGVYPPYIDFQRVQDECVPVWADLAPLVHNSPVAARLHDALWLSDQGWQHGRDAITHYRNAADAPVPDLVTVHYLQRAYYIAGVLKYKNDQSAIADQAAGILRRSIDQKLVRPNGFPGVLLSLLDLATAPVSHRAPGIFDLIRDCYRIYRSDYRHKMSIIRNKKAVCPELTPRLNGLMAWIAFDHARREPNDLQRDSKLQEALRLDKIAGGRLRDEIVEMLQQPIDASNFGIITAEAEIATDWSEHLGHGLSADLAYLLAKIGRLPDEGTIDTGLAGIIPTTFYSAAGYQVGHTADGVNTQQRRALSAEAETRAVVIGNGVQWIVKHYNLGIDDLTKALSSKRFLSDHHAGVFAQAILHFANNEFDECVHAAVPRIEGALRKFARSIGIPTYQAEAKKQMGLQPLIDKIKEIPAFHEYARWFDAGLMADGFRNNMAHDLNERTATYGHAARCVVMVLLLWDIGAGEPAS